MDADVAVLRRGEGAGSGGVEAWRDVGRSPGAAETLHTHEAVSAVCLQLL